MAKIVLLLIFGLSIGFGNSETPFSVYGDPFVMQKNGEFEGFCKDLLDEISTILEIKFEMRLSKDERYGVLVNGEWKGMIGEVVKKKVDLAIADLTITSSRQKVVDFTLPFVMSGISIMVKNPVTLESTSGSYLFLKPFSYHLWMYFIISYVFASLVLYLVARLSPSSRKSDRDTEYEDTASEAFGLKNSFWYLITPLGHRRAVAKHRPTGCGARIVICTWYLFTLVVVCVYIAQLTITLREDPGHGTITSIDDLANRKDVEYSCFGGGSTYEYFQNSKLKNHVRVAAYLKNEAQLITRTKDGVQRVRNSDGKYALLVESLTNDYYNTRKPCDTIRVGEPVNTRGFGIAAHLRSPLTHFLNLAILRLQETGVVEQLQHKWFVETSECPPLSKEKASSLPIQLQTSSIAGLFNIGFTLLVIAVVVAACEMVIGSKKDANRNKTSIFQAIKLSVSAKGENHYVVPGAQDKNETA